MSRTTELPIREFAYQRASPIPGSGVAGLSLSRSRLEMIQQIQEGLPPTAFEQLSEMTGVGADELAELVHISRRTVARRRERGEPLDSATSERLIRLALLYVKIVEVIGDEPMSRQWLRTPRAVFSGRTPLEMAQTELGAREVEDLLLRVEHGVFY